MNEPWQFILLVCLLVAVGTLLPFVVDDAAVSAMLNAFDR